MKHLIALLLAALAPAPTVAQTPTAPAPQSGEVALQISAVGSDARPADRIVIGLSIAASGTTTVEARGAASAKRDRAIKTLTARGINRATITTGPAGRGFGFVGNEMVDPEEESSLVVPPVAKRSATTSLRITLADPTGLTAVNQVADELDLAVAAPVVRTLRDDGDARRAAIAVAIARARADADTHAAALGMRVDRIVSVSNRAARPDDTQPIERMMAVWTTMSGDGGNDVVTEAGVTVDFILAPR